MQDTMQDVEDIILVDPDAIEKAKPKTFWIEGEHGERLSDSFLWESGMSIEVPVLQRGTFKGYRISTGEIISGCRPAPIPLFPSDRMRVHIFSGPCR